MPSPAYISIHGQTQGFITEGAFTADSVGNGFQEGHENQILVQEIEHLVSTPTDPQSGQPAGQRVHGPFTFTSSMNKAIPMLYQALTTGETLSTVDVEWHRVSINGGLEYFFTTRLEDATVVNIDLKLPHAQDPQMAGYTQLVKVAMAYRKITWTHKVCGTESSDDWRKPPAA